MITLMPEIQERDIDLPLGLVTMTPGAQDLFEAYGSLGSLFLAYCLKRHMTGNWGNVDKEDWETNDDALATGGRILSAYILDEDKPQSTRIWIITEADRSVTTILTPDEY